MGGSCWVGRLTSSSEWELLVGGEPDVGVDIGRGVRGEVGRGRRVGLVVTCLLLPWR